MSIDEPRCWALLSACWANEKCPPVRCSDITAAVVTLILITLSVPWGAAGSFPFPILKLCSRINAHFLFYFPLGTCGVCSCRKDLKFVCIWVFLSGVAVRLNVNGCLSNYTATLSAEVVTKKGGGYDFFFLSTLVSETKETPLLSSKVLCACMCGWALLYYLLNVLIV